MFKPPKVLEQWVNDGNGRAIYNHGNGAFVLVEKYTEIAVYVLPQHLNKTVLKRIHVRYFLQPEDITSLKKLNGTMKSCIQNRIADLDNQLSSYRDFLKGYEKGRERLGK